MKLLIVLVPIIIALTPSNVVAASQAQLNLRLLPINCIFEIINDGSNELIYLTPKRCGQLIDTPPVSQENPTVINNGESAAIFSPFFEFAPSDTNIPEASQPNRNKVENTGPPGDQASNFLSNDLPRHLILGVSLASLALTGSWWLAFKNKTLRKKILLWIKRPKDTG